MFKFIPSDNHCDFVENMLSNVETAFHYYCEKHSIDEFADKYNKLYDEFNKTIVGRKFKNNVSYDEIYKNMCVF